MPWSGSQRCRLALERNEIAAEYSASDIKWIDPSGETKVEQRVVTNRGNVYRLRVHVPDDFPNSAPEMVVCESPQPMPAWDNDLENHTLDRKGGLLNICYTYYHHWSASKSRIVDVFKKGRQWLEAYESSLATGRPINFYLDNAADANDFASDFAADMLNACASQ